MTKAIIRLTVKGYEKAYKYYYILIISLLLLALSSCTRYYCQPSKKSRDYALWLVKNIKGDTVFLDRKECKRRIRKKDSSI